LENAVVNGKKVPCEVKSTTMIVKSSTVINKTTSMIDKSPT